MFVKIYNESKVLVYLHTNKCYYYVIQIIQISNSMSGEITCDFYFYT